MYNKHLDAFLMAADCGSFTKAAEKLFISPNALIKQINLLEDRLELTLFLRTNHGVVLTEAGKSIYRDARRIIHISKQALVTAKALTTGKQNIIRLGSSLMNPCRPIVKLWVAVSSSYPHIKLSIVPIDDGKSDKQDFFAEKTGSADIIAGLFPSTLWKNKVNALKIRQLPLSVAVPINHPLASRKRLMLTSTARRSSWWSGATQFISTACAMSLKPRTRKSISTMYLPMTSAPSTMQLPRGIP